MLSLVIEHACFNGVVPFLQYAGVPVIQRVLDAIATEAFNLFAAGAYFGLWEGMEIYLNTYNLTVDELGISALETVVCE